MTAFVPDTARIMFASSLHIMDFGPDLSSLHWGVWSSNSESERWQNLYYFHTRDCEVLDKYEAHKKPIPDWLRNLYAYAMEHGCEWLALWDGHDVIEGFPINPAFMEPFE